MTTANTRVAQILLKRGNTVQSSSYVGPLGEVTLDTDLDTLRIHDGVTAGGFSILATKADIDQVNSNIGNISLGVVDTAPIIANVQAAVGATLNANVTAANINIARLDANLGTATTNITTLLANAVTQEGHITSLTASVTTISGTVNSLSANAVTQAVQINSLNANVTAANSSITTANTAMKSYVDDRFNSLDVTPDTFGNIIPSANLTYTLGNVTHQWKELWLSGNTIYLNNIPLSVTNGGSLLVNGAPVADGTTTDRLVSGDYTVSLESDGNLTLPGGLSIFNSNIGYTSSETITEETIGGTVSQTTTQQSQIEIAPTEIVIAKRTTQVVDDTVVTATDEEGSLLAITNDGAFLKQYVEPDGPENTSYFQIRANSGAILEGVTQTIEGNSFGRVTATQGSVVISTSSGTITKEWLFDNTGDLIIPNDGDIWFNYGYVGQSANIQDNALRVSGGNSVVINTSEDSTQWKFTADGNLVLPTILDFLSSPAGYLGGNIVFGDGTVQNTAFTGIPDVVTVSNTAPTNNNAWYNTEDGRLYVDANGTWVDASPSVIPGNMVAWDNDAIEFPDGSVQATAAGIYAGNTAPTVGFAWYNTEDGRTYNKVNGVWVDANPSVVPGDIVTYNSDGNITLPAGGQVTWANGRSILNSIIDTGNISFNNNQIRGTRTADYYGLIELVPSVSATVDGQYINFLQSGQYLKIFPTNQFDSPHIHITAGDGIGGEGDLFLGDDSKYVQVNNTGYVQIRTIDGGAWTFEQNGNLTLPNIGSSINYANGVSILSGISGGTAFTGALEGNQLSFDQTRVGAPAINKANDRITLWPSGSDWSYGIGIEAGHLWLNSGEGSDGIKMYKEGTRTFTFAPGGLTFPDGTTQSTASVASYGNTQVATYLAGGITTGNILPAANVTYNLGSATQQWNSLYVSSNTIYLGGVPLSVSGGSLLVNNSPVTADTGTVTFTNNQLKGASVGQTGTRIVYSTDYNGSTYNSGGGTVNGFFLPASITGTSSIAAGWTLTMNNGYTTTVTATGIGGGGAWYLVDIPSYAYNVTPPNPALFPLTLTSPDYSAGQESILQLTPNSEVASSTWTFYGNGVARFPDGTTQSTAYTGYGNTQVASYLIANPQAGTYSDSNVNAYLTSQNITSANIGGSQTYANTRVATLEANIGSFYTYANATYTGGAGSTYSNANVASYLPTYSGNISAANIVTTGATSGNISGANYISANVFQVSTGIFWANGTAWSSSGGGTTYTSSGSGNITVSGSTLALTATGPGAVSVGSSTAIPVITTDAYGRVSSTTTAAVVAPAGTLTGTTLAATVVTSSLTSVGTLTSLAVTGNVTTGNVSTTQVTATNIVTTGTYGNITGANVISANTVTVTTYVRTQPVTFANLPTGATAGAGARAFITDGNTTTFASAVSGGGANAVPVYSNGTNWYVG